MSDNLDLGVLSEQDLADMIKQAINSISYAQTLLDKVCNEMVKPDSHKPRNAFAYIKPKGQGQYFLHNAFFEFDWQARKTIQRLTWIAERLGNE